MQEETNDTVDEGVAAVGGIFGYSGDGPMAIVSNIKSLRNSNDEEVLKNQGAAFGLNLEIPEGETTLEAPDGGRGWLILAAATLLFCGTIVHMTFSSITLQTYHVSGMCDTTWPSQHEVKPEDHLRNLRDQFICSEDTDLFVNITYALFDLNRSSEIQTIVNQTFEELIAEKLRQAKTNQAVVKQVDTTFQLLSSLFGVISSTLILKIGYRLVALAGSALVIVGVLVTIFIDGLNVHLITFFYGVLPGISQNMIFVSSYIAIMEYFKKRRMTALTIMTAVSVLFTFGLGMLLIFVFDSWGINTWKSYLFFELGCVITMLPTSLVLKPLKLEMKDTPNKSFLSEVLKIKLSLYKRPILYTFALVWFLWNGGIAIVTSKLPLYKAFEIKPFIKGGQILVLILAVSTVVGALSSCCCQKKLSLKVLLLMVAVDCVLAGFFTFLTSQLHNLVYATVYSAVIGLLRGISMPLLTFSIPPVLGEENMTVGTGVMMLAKGLGELTMVAAGDEIYTRTMKADGCFYLTGILFVLGFGFVLLTCKLVFKNTRQQQPR